MFEFFADTLNRSVVVKVVINEEYKPEYADKKSPEYKEFVGNFTDQVNETCDELSCMVQLCTY